MNATAPAPYQPVLIPALNRIQHQYGYLKREALEAYSAESGVPLCRLQSVASFFPHFRHEPSKPVMIRVCRDMACHMAGSSRIVHELRQAFGNEVEVAPVSCLGRCDRPPAACVSIEGLHGEHYYHARTAETLKGIVSQCLKGNPPHADHDADQTSPLRSAEIDPYRNGNPKYAAVLKAIQARDASLTASATHLTEKFGWSSSETGQFRVAAAGQLDVAFPLDDKLVSAVRSWQTESDWAKGPELGGWAEAVLTQFTEGDLRGLGGAGIPTAQKLRDVRDAIRTARKRGEDDRGFIVVNGDESEPGTFKDREILLRTPHLVVEAVILAGLITEATQGFIYIRHEYEEQIAACEAEIRKAEEIGLCGTNASILGRSFPISVFVSPGGYICGEQSALIEAMSDRRGEPRNMPPKLETNGLIDLPTIVSNVETYAWMPYIYSKGGKTYADLGVNGCKGRRLFSVSGDVNRPGVYEVPMGLPLRELIFGDNYCRGIIENRKLKGFAPSGPSGGFLPAKLTATKGLPRKHTENATWKALAERRGFDPAASELDILDLELELNVFRALSPTQALGAGLVVYAEGRDMADQAVNALEFFRNESCGKCVPCRLGSEKLAALGTNLREGHISQAQWDDVLLPLTRELGRAIEMASICGLGRSVPVPLRTVADFFAADVSQHLVMSQSK
jgi:NADH:ubiquinone oxidoreductase subunit F (NADH-binding)/NADH:ubiquinone oxidoreductase subunit E